MRKIPLEAISYKQLADMIHYLQMIFDGEISVDPDDIIDDVMMKKEDVIKCHEAIRFLKGIEV